MTPNPPRLLQHVPPHNLEAEQQVLGGLLVAGSRGQNLLDQVQGLTPEDFYYPAYQTIFRAILDVADAGQPTDLTGVGTRLHECGLFEKAGGAQCINELVSCVMSPTMGVTHAHKVLACSRRRQLAERATALFENAHQPGVSFEQLQEQVQELASMGGQAVAGAKPLRFLSLDEMTSEPAPIEWLVRGYLEAQTLSVLFGASGSMKSFLAIDMGMSIATGTPWHGFRIPNPGSVLYIAGEGFQGLRKRLRAWRVAHDVQHAPFYTAERGVQFPDKTAAAEVRQEAQRLEQAPRLIIIDTLARSLVGDENNAADMSAFIQGLDELRHDLQCAILIVHHSGWSEKERSRGSSALRAALDFEYRLDVRDEIRLLKATKVKDHEYPQDLAFEVEEVATGWTDPETGDEINSCVLRRSNTPDVLKPKPKLTGATRIAFEALVECTNRRRDEGGNIDLGTIKIHLDEWREQALSDGITDSTKEDSKQKAFKRAVSRLRDIARVETRDEYYWICE